MKVVASSGLLGEATPPPAVSLICDAPCSNCSRTRIGVDFVLELLASGWSGQRILDEYPQLKADDLQAVFAFVRDCLKDEDFVLRAKAAESLLD